MPDRQQILNSITTVAKKLGRAPSEKEFNSLSEISAYYVMQHFRSWNDAVRAARLRPYTLNFRPKDHALLEDWGRAVRRHRGVPLRRAYSRQGKYNPRTLERRFGPWSRMPETFRNFARRKREWADVVALLAPVPRTRTRRGSHQRPRNNSASAASQLEKWHARRKDRPIYGNPSEFRWLRHEPLNEQGVVLLFGMLARELGYMIESVQTGFPDCEAKRRVAAGQWQRVRIEFEFESKNFRDHGHPPNGCDVIVCWRDNWDDRPACLEVVELSRVVKSLGGSED